MVRHDSSIKDQTANPGVFSSCGSAYEKESRLWKTPSFRCVAKKTQLQQGSPLASLRFHCEADFAGTIGYSAQYLRIGYPNFPFFPILDNSCNIFPSSLNSSMV